MDHLGEQTNRASKPLQPALNFLNSKLVLSSVCSYGWPNYYDWSLESRRNVLGSSSVVSFRITKCLLMQVNIQASSNILDCSDRNNSKYYVVVNFLYSLNEGKIPKKRFNRQLAPEETSIKLLFPDLNGVIFVECAEIILVILDEAITKLRPNFFWLDGLKSSFKVSTFHMKYHIL
ncbi:BnaA01g17240D [Brassica napus]|uniref:BnaA01g17240D protein n=1 Tax=Brassica napus TaxID=3708 RepID=A0A078H0N0_BRANA|nr:BnaA01g17240D [Brassica napus]